MKKLGSNLSLSVYSKKPLVPFIGYLIFLYVAWTFAFVYGVFPWALNTLGDSALSYAVINIIFRFLICVLPVFLYLKYVDKVNVFEYLQLKQYWKRGVVVGFTAVAIFLLIIIAIIGMPNLSSAHITWNNILSTSILIGFFEEIPFRGFVLKKLQERLSFWLSMIISSILFAGMHVPGWILFNSFTLFDAVFTFVFGVLMVIILKYSKSLWGPIVAHNLKDFTSIVLFWP